MAVGARPENHPVGQICRLAGLLSLALLVLARLASGAQSTNAILTGEVVDTTHAVLRGAEVAAINVETAAVSQTKSGSNGEFTLATLPPGRYILRATLSGFRPHEVQDIVLSVGDRLDVRIELVVASRDEGVTVVADAVATSTSPAVSTVIDRQFVENLPLNGRSLQSLLELTPGVLLVPVESSRGGGQFSVNGQRSNSNYFMVDGVSANSSMGAGGLLSAPGTSASGQLPAMNALGGTNGLVSVDSLEEFRIQTSTYAPEFGRTPGGQISMVTRSGTNVFHGSAFEYFRDESMDAIDWFTNRLGQPEPEMMQHNFGGVLGGPILRKRLFFFGSYEGLRLLQPRPATVNVPTVAAREAATPFVRQLLNAFPLPNGRDFGNGNAEFQASFSDPARSDSTSVRVDMNTSSALRLFARINHAPSYSKARSNALSVTNVTHVNNDSLTGGATWIQSGRLVHDLRVNHSRNSAPYFSELDTFGGAVLPPASIFNYGRTPDDAIITVGLISGSSWWWGKGSDYLQRQFNIVHSSTLTTSRHEVKAGVDYRRMYPLLNGTLAGVENYFISAANSSQGIASSYVVSVRAAEEQAVAFDNLSIFAQDSWRIHPRLTLTYGLRWELVPPPHATTGPQAVTLDGIEDPYSSNVHLAPQGTSLWKTRYSEFAPRVGASYKVADIAGGPLVARGGFGVFYDIGYGTVANAYGLTYPVYTRKSLVAVPLPVSGSNLVLPRFVEDPPQQLYVMDRNLRQPLTYQWNVSVEQSLGARQSITASYVGAEGRRLLKAERYNVQLQEWPTVRTPIDFSANVGYSDYQALQLKFQRRLHAGIQTIISYTLGRSRDTSSGDGVTTVPVERLSPDVDFGFSDFDVRHVVTAAVTWQTPEMVGNSIWKRVAEKWGVDAMVRGRSAFPLRLSATIPFPPDNQSVRPNVVSGQPIWIDDSSAPGGRRLNRAAFVIPGPNTQGNLKRGEIRGFGASQVDIALRRDFPMPGGTRLQFRFEMFNILNIPSFSDPVGLLTSPLFGESTQTLGRAYGGLTPLYQIGGPRSSQIAVKVLF